MEVSSVKRNSNKNKRLKSFPPRIWISTSLDLSSPDPCTDEREGGPNKDLVQRQKRIFAQTNVGGKINNQAGCISRSENVLS